MRAKIIRYLKGNKHYWWTVGVLPGLYALLYLYSNNYTLLNSWSQFTELVLWFIALPSLLVIILDYVFKRLLSTSRQVFYMIFLGINCAVLIPLSVYMQWKIKLILLICAVAIGIGIYIARSYKLIVLLLGFTSVISALQLAYLYSTAVTSKEDWVETMTDFKFVKKPNIYLIQPDGYVAPTTLNDRNYNYSNNNFWNFLDEKRFDISPEYRTNYSSTLSSNSALFTASHHYLNGTNVLGEVLNARNIILGKNPVLKTLKDNGYKLNLFTDTNYFFLNHASTVYDDVNLNLSKQPALPYFKDGIHFIQQLTDHVKSQEQQPQFYFIQNLLPGHVAVNSIVGQTVAKERSIYLSKLEKANLLIKTYVDLIIKEDANAIILIVADHGGFVGYKNTSEIKLRPEKDIILKNSMFNALMAIRAPEDFKIYQENIKSSVGVFPNLFAYLSNMPVVDCDDNSSYLRVEHEGTMQLFKYFDATGASVLEVVE